ncbi:MAG: TIGR03087 family PEP-CTERM/XrtA system glycosyltransferase [Parerythrobacter sp.]
MGDILFLAHRIPFPPDRGDKIRSHHLLHKLAGMAPVHVGCFGETDTDMTAETELSGLAASHLLTRRTKPLYRAGIEALATRRPVSLTAFRQQAMHDWVARTLARNSVDTVFVFSGQMGQYIPRDYNRRIVIDLCDVDSAKFDAYAKGRRWPRALVDRREGRLLAHEEQRLCARAHATLLVSENEASLFRRRVPASLSSKVHTIRNGIDATLFDPDMVTGENPFPGGPDIVFTGQMDYAPNIAAVTRAAHHLMPEICAHYPAATLHIVGRAPTAAVQALDELSGVRVWGEVPDVKPFLAHADIVIAPLTIARGIQNKVLEAMAMARPVVLSTEAATGIDATDGTHFAIGGDNRALVDATLALLADPAWRDAMGAAARQYVVMHQGWNAMLAPLDTLVTGVRAEVRDAA